ncbi:MAG: hypothetical protein AAFZ58_00655 [Pseudomonadota bacterium]
MSNVWCADDTRLGELVFLGQENLVIDSPDKDDAQRIREELLAGATPATLLSSKATTIALHAVSKISTDRNDTDIDVEYQDGKDSEETTLHFKTAEARDQALAAFKTLYSGRFELFEEAYSRPQAVFMPLVATTICGFLTFIFAMAAGQLGGGGEADVDGSATKRIVAGILEVIGPLGVWIVGGLITLLCALAVFGAAKEPPVMLTLQAPPYKRQSVAKLLVKYAGLLAAWAYLVMVAINWN